VNGIPYGLGELTKKNMKIGQCKIFGTFINGKLYGPGLIIEDESI
jgi:hypothetical protein